MPENLPPGVSGNEWQIAGRPSNEVVRKCDRQGIRRATMSWESAGALQTLRGDLGRMTNLARATRRAFEVGGNQQELAEGTLSMVNQTALAYDKLNKALVAGLEFVDFDECPFDGPVEVDYDGHVEWWTCPVCGTEHEDEDTRAEDAAIEAADALRKGE